MRGISNNLILSETEFGDFQRYCREKGFDLSYFSSGILDSRKEIEQHQVDDFQVIKIIKHKFTYTGIPYSVAEWQQDKWRNQFLEIQEDFIKNKTKIA
jgi:hypothetical protein